MRVKKNLTLEQKLTLDEPLSGEIEQEAEIFLSELDQLQDLTLPRCFLKSAESRIVEIATFADASSKAYAAVVYVISVDPDGSRNSHLAFSKTRVRPLGKRLETHSEEMSNVASNCLQHS